MQCVVLNAHWRHRLDSCYYRHSGHPTVAFRWRARRESCQWGPSSLRPITRRDLGQIRTTWGALNLACPVHIWSQWNSPTKLNQAHPLSLKVQYLTRVCLIPSCLVKYGMRPSWGFNMYKDVNLNNMQSDYIWRIYLHNQINIICNHADAYKCV